MGKVVPATRTANSPAAFVSDERPRVAPEPDVDTMAPATGFLFSSRTCPFARANGWEVKARLRIAGSANPADSIAYAGCIPLIWYERERRDAKVKFPLASLSVTAEVSSGPFSVIRAPATPEPRLVSRKLP